jgi:hypothetical protein
MANLQATTISSSLTISNSGLVTSNGTADISDWYKIYHCHGTSTTRLHIRTPLSADTNAIGWNPVIIEVHGYHSYNGEKVHDFKALVNANGYNNDWYGSQIRSDNGYNSSPYIYRSSSTYGGSTRVCIAVNKEAGCQNGWIWVRWFNQSSWATSYAWGVSSSTDNNPLF